jgi:transcriptional regulator with XRE-family HTH domain
MSTKDRAADRGTRRGLRLLSELGDQAREARLAAGLMQRDVAVGVGISQPQVSRIERGLDLSLDIPTAARLLSVLGHDLSIRALPTGPPLRDAAHLGLLARLRSRVSDQFVWRYEVPLPIPGSLQAFDAVLTGSGVRIAIEAETRLRDLQALQREIELKLRDRQVDRLVLLIAATRRNRALVRDHGTTLQTLCPMPPRRLLLALEAGRDPGSNGIVLL